MNRFALILTLALFGCSTYELPELYSADEVQMRRPTNPGGGNGGNQDPVNCNYSFNDNSEQLTLLNPNDVEVFHYTDFDLAAQGEAVNILFIFTNHSGYPIGSNPASSVEFSMDEFGYGFFDRDDGARKFFEEASFGDVSVTGTVIGWMDFADSTTSNLSLYGGGFLALAEQYVDLDDYDMVALASTYPGQLRSGSGIQIDCATLDDRVLDYSGVTFFHRPAVITQEPVGAMTMSGSTSVLPESIFAHEIVHAMGVAGHALGLNCGTQSWASDCDIIPYGDPFSIQGDRVWSSHPGAWHKYLMGWIGDSQFVTVDSSDTFELHPLEEPLGNLYGLSIPLAAPVILDNGVEYDRIMIDYRTPVGFDYRIDNINDYHNSWGLDPGIDTDGVYLYFGYANGSHSTVLINTHPLEPYDEDSFSPHGLRGETARNAHAMLNVGETFVLPNGTGSVTVMGHSMIHMPGNMGYPNNEVQGIEVEVTLN